MTLAEGDQKTVVQALSDVMQAVQAVRKGDRNAQQGFNFRGIDAVVNAVGPVLREHGVIFVPAAQQLTSERYESRAGAAMRNVTVKIDWNIYGPAGDSITATTYGEAADSGDKAVSKAHSVAYRTALLQTLCIPTDEPDPDAAVHERSARPVPKVPDIVKARAELVEVVASAYPDTLEDARNDWIKQQLTEKGLDSSNPADLRKLASSVVIPQ